MTKKFINFPGVTFEIPGDRSAFVIIHHQVRKSWVTRQVAAQIIRGIRNTLRSLAQRPLGRVERQ